MIRITMNASMFLLMFTLSYCLQAKEQNNSIQLSSGLSLSERADSLHSLYQLIQQAIDPKTKDHYELLFFEVFPDSFQLLDSLYGYKEESGPSILYFQAVNHIVKVFFNLDNIPEEDFAQKVIELSFYGTWDADAISYFQQGVRNNTKANVELYCSLLSDYSDDKLLSFWYFLFDGPHPENHQGYYVNLQEKAKIFDPSIAEFMRQAYHKLLADHDGHGH